MALLNSIIIFIIFVSIVGFLYLKLKHSAGSSNEQNLYNKMKITGGSDSSNKLNVVNHLINKTNNHLFKTMLLALKYDLSGDKAKSKDMNVILKCTKDAPEFAALGYTENSNINKCILDEVKDGHLALISRNNLDREEFYKTKPLFKNLNNNLNILPSSKSSFISGIKYLTDESERKDGTFFKFRIYGLPNETNSKTLSIVFNNIKPDADIVLKTEDSMENFNMDKALQLIKDKYNIKSFTLPTAYSISNLHPLRTVPLIVSY